MVGRWSVITARACLWSALWRSICSRKLDIWSAIWSRSRVLALSILSICSRSILTSTCSALVSLWISRFSIWFLIGSCRSAGLVFENTLSSSDSSISQCPRAFLFALNLLFKSSVLRASSSVDFATPALFAALFNDSFAMVLLSPDSGSWLVLTLFIYQFRQNHPSWEVGQGATDDLTQSLLRLAVTYKRRACIFGGVAVRGLALSKGDPVGL